MTEQNDNEKLQEKPPVPEIELRLGARVVLVRLSTETLAYGSAPVLLGDCIGALGEMLLHSRPGRDELPAVKLAREWRIEMAQGVFDRAVRRLGAGGLGLVVRDSAPTVEPKRQAPRPVEHAVITPAPGSLPDVNRRLDALEQRQTPGAYAASVATKAQKATTQPVNHHKEQDHDATFGR